MITPAAACCAAAIRLVFKLKRYVIAAVSGNLAHWLRFTIAARMCLKDNSKKMTMTQSLTPLLAIHICAALTAVVLGPFAIWARLGQTARPRLHRAFGYAWVTMMVVAATSAIWIRGVSTTIPRWNGYSPIHLLIFVVFFALFGAFWFLARGNIRGHKITMLILYISACIVTGLFTLSPGRLMNTLVFG